MTKTTTPVGFPADPSAFTYVAATLENAGRTVTSFQASVDNMIRAFEKARASLLPVIEQYYFDREAEARWDDEGGAIRR